jgi:hypothetical protein
MPRIVMDQHGLVPARREILDAAFPAFGDTCRDTEFGSIIGLPTGISEDHPGDGTFSRSMTSS